MGRGPEPSRSPKSSCLQNFNEEEKEIAHFLVGSVDEGGYIRRDILDIVDDLAFTQNIFTSEEKVVEIITIAENSIFSEDLEVEVEYQNSTIGKYALDFNGNSFLLKSKTTNCLAEDQCGIEISKPKVSISDINEVDSNCSPGSGCC